MFPKALPATNKPSNQIYALKKRSSNAGPRSNSLQDTFRCAETDAVKVAVRDGCGPALLPDAVRLEALWNNRPGHLAANAVRRSEDAQIKCFFTTTDGS